MSGILQPPMRALHRFAAGAVTTALADTPVVLVVGARQTGKTTLVTRLAGTSGARYATLDDTATLAAVKQDPAGFIGGLGPRAVLDEVQRAPELFLPIKASVDRDRRPGRFLLTGSANVLLLPRLADSLAGRMEIVRLWPLSQGEIAGSRDGFIDAVFGESLAAVPTGVSKADVIGAALVGGYPPVVGLAPERREAWFRSYVTTMLERDVRDLAQIEQLTAMPQLLQLLASRSGAVLNAAGLGRELALPNTTLRRYLALLELTFLVTRLPSWSVNLGKRVVKAPKLYLSDSGLMAYLALVTEERLRHDPTLAGSLVETFVVTELLKQVEWSATRPAFYHFRTDAGQEVDMVLERRDGAIVGVEVKAGETIGPADFKGLAALRDLAKGRFHRGVLLYAGPHALPFGEKLWAMPMSALWTV